jgi:hypothetical protein
MAYDLIGSFAPMEETGTHVRISGDASFAAMTGEMLSGVSMESSFSAMTGEMTALVGAVVSMDASFGAMSGEMFTGASLEGSFGAMSGEMSGTVTVIVDIDDSFPAMTGEMSALTGVIARMDGSFGAMSGEMSSFETISGDMEGSFAPMSGTMSASVGLVCSLEGSFGAMSGEMSGITGIIATMNGSFGAMTGEMVSSSRWYETFCMNLVNKVLVSKFTNFSFDSYGIVNEIPVAGKAGGGLYRLGGASDAGTPIISVVSTPDLTFGTRLLKKLRAMSVGGKISGRLVVTASNGNESWSIEIVPDRASAGFMTGYFPHSARGGYLNFSITNPDGTDFFIDAMSLYMMVLER